MKAQATIAMAMMALASTAFAGLLKTDQVAGDAKWVAHVDVSAMLDSGLGKFILAEAQKKADFVNKVTDLRQKFGFDLTRDVRGVTLYGKKVGPKAGVIVLDMTVDQQKVLELLEANETHREIKYGDRTLHQWTDPAKVGPEGEDILGKTSFGVFYDEKTIVVASGLDLLKEAIDVLDSKADSLAKTKGLPMLPKPVAGEIMVAVASGIELPALAAKPKAAVLRHITDISLQAGENADGSFAEVVALVSDAKKAGQLRNVVQGFVALGQMIMAEREDLPVLGEKITVNGADQAVTVSAAVPTDSLIEMLKFLRDRRAEKAKAQVEVEVETR